MTKSIPWYHCAADAYDHPNHHVHMQARPFTRPETAIPALHTTKKRRLLKPALSRLSSTEGTN